MDGGTCAASLLTAESRGTSLISMRSSSSLLDRVPLTPGDATAWLMCAHFPLGSIMTWSTARGVDVKMSSTYLRSLATTSECLAGNTLLVNLERLEGDYFVAHWACPRWRLLLELEERRSIKALIVAADSRPTWNIDP